MIPPEAGEPLDAAGLPAVEAEFHLSEYLAILRKHWRLIAAIGGLCVVVAIVQYLITPKQYRAATVIQIERRSLTAVSGNSNPWLENYWNMEFYPTQYRLLASRGLAERVARGLGLQDDPHFGGGRTKSLSSAAAEDQAALGAIGGRLLGGLQVEPVKGTQLVEISYVSEDPELAARIANGFADSFIDWGIEERSTTAGKASTFLGSQIEALKQEIQDKSTQLEAYSRRADIVTLDPASNVTLQRLGSLNTDYAKAVSERIDREARYNELQSGSEETVADALSGGLVGTQRGELLKLEQEYADKLTTYKPEWPAMVELKSRIDRARKSMQQLITETVASAREKARGEYQTALRREQSLQQELEKIKSENLQLNSAAVEYNNLKLEVSTRRALLDDLMRRQSETGLSSRLQATRESNIRVVDRAMVPGGPFRPSLQNSLKYGVGLGLVLGIGCALLIEFLDRTIKTPEQVERTLGLPVLAVIPDVGTEGSYGYGYSYVYGYGERPGPVVAAAAKLKGKKRGAAPRPEGEREHPSSDTQIELIPHLRPQLAVAEAYRALRTALLLSSADELKVVAITSAHSGEGKTVTTANLAVVMAQLGKKVLLVDADLRRPRLHKIFQLSNRVGLVSYLTGTADPSKVFFETQVPKLFLCPSGPTPPNPSELLASERMRSFLAGGRNHFDIVLIDSPPVLVVTDATVAGAAADGVVLCLRAGRVLRPEARTVRDRLRIADVKLLGVVLNFHRAPKGRYGSAYSHYYYQAYGERSDAPASGSAA